MQNIIKKVLYNVFSKLRVNQKLITFESYGGKNFSCNCKAIYDEIKEKKLDYSCKIFINKNVTLDEKYKEDIVYRGTIKWIYYTATSKYWIKNTGAYGGLPKRKNQIYINTWHSGSILKKQGYDIENVPLEKRTPKDNVKDWDWYVAGSEEKAKVLNNSTGYKGNTVVIGMPRIDYLINFKQEDIKRIKKKLNIEQKRVIFYAPTWRDNDVEGKNNSSILDGIIIPDGYVMLVKFHPLVKYTSINNEKIINVSKYNDINELFVIADVLISDYSSVIFDYSNLKKPIILYAYDFDEYKDLRDFYIDYEKTMPGPIVKTIDELNEELTKIDTISIRYREKQEKFYESYCSSNDGQATKRFIDLLVSGYFDGSAKNENCNNIWDF